MNTKATTEQVFELFVPGLWPALQDFAAEKKIMLTPKGNEGHGVTLSMKKDGKDIEIGKVTVSSENLFHFHFKMEEDRQASFGYTSADDIRQCLKSVRDHINELLQPEAPDPRAVKATRRVLEA